MAALRDPVPFPDRPRLVGRGRELGVLRERLDTALAGRGGLVLIGGEAGIGKTALAEAMCAEAAGRGALTLVGRCYDLSETPPYGPWAEAFARAPGGDGPPPPDLAGGAGAGSQAALFAQVRDYVVALAARRPLVLLLDDAHWADPASLDLLRVLARGLVDTPLLLIAIYRSDELTRRHPLYALLPLLVREARAERLDLRPLDDAGVRALVAERYALGPADAGRLVAYLRDRAEGNPFFAGELMRALAEEGALCHGDDGWALGDLAAVGVPPLLRQVLDARVDRLGDAARDLLAVAAVVGQEMPLALWRAVAGADEAALLAVTERAVEARLLAETPDGAGVRFAHALVREALYEGILGPRRRALHRRAGEALAAGPVPHPDAVAHHFDRAGDPRAVEWLVAAGERAVRAHAYQTATARFEAALARLGEGSDSIERAWLLFRLGVVWRHVDPGRAVAYLDAASGLAGEDAALAALAALYRGYASGMGGDQPGRLAGLQAGEAALRALAPAERARLAARGAVAGLPLAALDPRGDLVLALAEGGRPGEAVALGEALLAEPRPPTAAAGPLLRGAYFGLAVARTLLGRPAEAARAYAAARERYGATGDPLGAFLAAGQELEFVALPYRADDVAGRRRLGALVEVWWVRTGFAAVLGLPAATVRLALLVLEGGWGAARGLAEAAYRRLSPLWGIWAGLHLGALARAQGDAVTARGVVADWLPAGPATEPGTVAFSFATGSMRLGAALALDAGDLPEARAWLEAHDRWLAWAGAVLGRAEGALGWAEYHRAAGDLDAATEHAEAALAHAAEPRQPLALLAAHRLLGELATGMGQNAEAAARLADALALADACAAPYERALTLLALADLRLAAGEREATAAALTEARAILEPLGAQPALARADALAARLVPATSAAPTFPAGLTAREAEVLLLVARGLSNAEVAERLFLSPRTVNSHLTHIYAKLGVDGRPAAIRTALDHGLR